MHNSKDKRILLASISLQLDIAKDCFTKLMLSLHTCSLVCKRIVCDASYIAGQECKQQKHDVKFI